MYHIFFKHVHFNCWKICLSSLKEWVLFHEWWAAFWKSKADIWFYLFFCLATKLCPIVLWPHGLWPASSSVHGIFQVKILEWLPFPSPRHLPDPGIKHTSPALTGGFLTTEPPRKPILSLSLSESRQHDNISYMFYSPSSIILSL